MFRLANFEIANNELIFFALRGTSPVEIDGGFASSHTLIDMGVDFLHMRCTLGQWRPGSGFALYPGSTVPHLRGVEARVGPKKKGAGVNMIAPCYLRDFARNFGSSLQ